MLPVLPECRTFVRISYVAVKVLSTLVKASEEYGTEITTSIPLDPSLIVAIASTSK
jgi:hypothetical protein